MKKNSPLNEEQLKQLEKDFPYFTTLELQHRYGIGNFSVLGYAYRNGWKKHPSLTRAVSNERNKVLKESLGVKENKLLQNDKIPWQEIMTGNLIKRIGNVTIHRGI